MTTQTRSGNIFSLYAELSKSGIVILVLISVLGGYLIGQPSEIPLNLVRMFVTLAGVLFLASGSSALNQYQERHIDIQMPRTAKRPLPAGRLDPDKVLAFVVLWVSIGLIVLAWLGAELFFLGLAAVIFYNGFYTLWWKKHWAYAAIPGAIPGALPILMGHVSSSGESLSAAGAYLFFVLFYWQMPHFWVLALRYRKDYEMGGFPTLPVIHGSGVTVFQITLWCLSYVALLLMAPLFLRVGTVYIATAILTSAKVLYELRGFAKEPESKRWLRFFLWVTFSLIIVLAAAAVDLWSVHLLPYFI